MKIILKYKGDVVKGSQEGEHQLMQGAPQNSHFKNL